MRQYVQNLNLSFLKYSEDYSQKNIPNSKFFIFLMNYNLIILFPLASCNLIFKPTKQTGIETAYVFVQGAEIPAINYQKYALKLQEKFDGNSI